MMSVNFLQIYAKELEWKECIGHHSDAYELSINSLTTGILQLENQQLAPRSF
jgi:hypothetical protein